MQIYPISAQKVKFWLLSCTLSKMLCFIIKGKKERKSYSVLVLSIKLSFKCQMYIPRSSKYPSVFSGYNKNTPTWSKTVPANLNLQLLGALSRVTFLVQLPLLCMWWLIRPQSLQNWTQLQNRYDMMHYVTKQTMGAPRSQTLKMASLKKKSSETTKALIFLYGR